MYKFSSLSKLISLSIGNFVFFLNLSPFPPNFISNCLFIQFPHSPPFLLLYSLSFFLSVLKSLHFLSIQYLTNSFLCFQFQHILIYFFLSIFLNLPHYHHLQYSPPRYHQVSFFSFYLLLLFLQQFYFVHFFYCIVISKSVLLMMSFKIACTIN